MHWADKIAQDLVQAHPEKESFVCAAGISPSGTVHIGNFRDIATTFFVARALRDLGKKTRLLFSWDEFDRFRKVPAGIPAEFSQYIGKPYAEIPDPFGCHESYARHYEREFEEAIQHFGIELDYRYQATEYRSGRYADGVILALQKRKEIYDILADYRTQASSDEERENYYPISIYCKNCGKDDTKVRKIADDCRSLTYSCRCGNEEELDLTRDTNFKLPWKVDWPMRWMVEKVDFEPGGKDHATPGGSYYVSKRVSEEIYHYPAPVFLGYEFIGIKGTTGKMSGSSGLAFSPGDLLKIYQPELIRWTFARFAPNKAFNLCLDEEILRQYDEFDRELAAVREGRAPDYMQRYMEMTLMPGRELKTVPFRLLANFSTIVQGNIALLEEMFERVGTPYKRPDFGERLEKAEYWMEKYSPESVVRLNATPDQELFDGLATEEKHWVHQLREFLTQGNIPAAELSSYLYAIPKDDSLEDKENKQRQRRFFGVVYQLLIGRDTGPMLATLIQALGSERVLSLITFER